MLVNGRQYISLKTAALAADRNVEYLLGLIKRPHYPAIPAIKVGGRWYVDSLAVKDYRDHHNSSPCKRVKTFIQQNAVTVGVQDKTLQRQLETALGLSVSTKTIYRARVELGLYKRPQSRAA